MTSLHRKITLAFLTFAILTGSLAAFSFLDLLFLENQMQQGMVINTLESNVQSMRREEKNLFLYKDEAARKEAVSLAAKTLQLLRDQTAALEAVDDNGQLVSLNGALQDYHRQLQQYSLPSPPDGEPEAVIRTLGHQISRISEDLFVQEHQLLQRAVSGAKWGQAIAIGVLTILLLIVGRLLARSVVEPMKRLIEELNTIAAGQFERLPIQSRNAELIALRKAFNRMLSELEARRRRLIQSEKLAALGVLVSGVAHELNNPLSNISSSCQLLLEEMDNAEHEMLMEWARTIDGETERARRIVDALLDFGRRREPYRETVNLAELLERTLLLLQGEFRKTRTPPVVTDLPHELVMQVDVQRMQQVLINLLRNAADCGDGVQITVSARQLPADEVRIPDNATVIGEPRCDPRTVKQVTEIMIADNGPGIAAADLPRIFEPFYTTRKTGQGMGLGLYIVQEVVQEHEGCIAVTSNPGKGTQVIIRLPEKR